MIVTPVPQAFAQLGGVPEPGNVLLILADDLGVDSLRSYGRGSDFPNTPTIDRLGSEGVLFRNAWATPKCSPTRATILTGRYGFRTGIMGLVSSTDLQALSPDELTIPEALLLGNETHQDAMFGKWHLGNCLNGKEEGPNIAGFSRYAGSFANLTNRNQSFFDWEKTVDGVTTRSQTYATTDSVDDAIAWITEQSEPWFLYLSLNAPHAPFQIPPHDLVSPPTFARLPKDALGATQPAGTYCEEADARICYLAMVEAMDAEIGRLLASMSPAVRDQTTIIFLGDNGTPSDVVRPPFDAGRAKSTLFEGGINVPLIIQGAGVVSPNRESAALVNTTDLFATSLELATGQAIADFLPLDLVHDSVSLVPILNDTATAAEHRTYAYSELFHPTRGQVEKHFGHTIRNDRYKLIRFTTRDSEAFYDLLRDPFENTNLINGSLSAAQAENLATLRQQLAELRAPVEFACPVEVLCSDCNRCEVDDPGPGGCTSINTGAAFCQRPDTTEFSCPEGQTIHMVRCPCTGPNSTCTQRQDQHLVCAIDTPAPDPSAAVTIGFFRRGLWAFDLNRNGRWEGCGTDGCLGFGLASDHPVSGDWTGSGTDKVGVFRNGRWYLNANGNGTWDGCTDDTCIRFGLASDHPIAGDWTGSGTDKVGVFRNGRWYLDANGNGTWDGCTIDICARFGLASDQPVVGDWTGSGTDKIGIFRNGRWYLDANGNGTWDGCTIDICARFGLASDQPVVGDWVGSGSDRIGVFRHGVWYLDANGSQAWDNCEVDSCLRFGVAGDQPIARQR